MSVGAEAKSKRNVLNFAALDWVNPFIVNEEPEKQLLARIR
jgi:hypothetical protein